MTFRSGLRVKAGFIVAQADANVTVLVDGAAVDLDLHKVKEVPSRLVAGVPSAAYRVISAAKESLQDQADEVLKHLPVLLKTVGARRAFALAAFQRADDKSIREHSGLGQAEQTWLLMWLAHNLGDSQAVMEHLSNLPPDGYPDKVGVIAAHWAVASQEPARAVAVWHLRGVSEEPLAAVLLFLLGEKRSSDIETFVAALPVAATGVRLDSTGLAKLRVLAGVDEPGSSCVDVLPPQASVAFALRHGRWPGNDPFSKQDDEVPSEPELLLAGAILSAGESVTDSLVDAGLLGPHFAAIAAATSRSTYLCGRLTPERLSEEELEALGHGAERARRALIAGEHPTGAASRPYVLLDALRSGDASVLAELVPMLAEPHRAVALALGRSIRDRKVDVEALVDRSAWPLLAQCLPNGKELGSAHPGVKRLSEWWSLEQAEERLLEWDWDGAAVAARECLRTAEDEDTRDEALNLLACALYQQGNVEGARRALEEALAGVDSPELIINYGIVAGEDDKHAASTELARLAVEAPTLELRLTAARRALALWSNHVPGDGDTDDPPSSLIAAMRALTVERTGLDEHAEIMRFLSWADDEWLADERHTRGSPYADTPQHTYLVARAKGSTEAVAELARWSRMRPEDEWLIGERKSVADMLINIMVTSEDPRPGIAAWALELSDSGMTFEPRQAILLPVLAVREFAIWMLRDEDCDSGPKLELLDRIAAARKLLASQPDLDAELFEDFIRDTVEKFAYAAWQGWSAQSDAIVDAYNRILGQVSGMNRRQINRQAVRQATDPLLAGLAEIEREVEQVVGEGLKNPKFLEDLDNLVNHGRTMHQAILKLPR